MPFATAQDMLDRIDSRWLRQLVLDNDQMATEAQFLASTRVEAALSDSAGEILAALRQGNRYTAAELAALTDDGLAFLVWMNVQLAAGNLAMGRQVPAEDIARTIPGYGKATGYLEQLQLGNRILDIESAAQAGLPAQQRQRSRLVCQAHRMFGNVYDPEPCCPPVTTDTAPGCT